LFSQKKDTAILGTWKGESICQIKSSPCHDEIAVYHLSKLKEPNIFEFVMNKMVNGKEEDMGVLQYVYDDKLQTLTCLDEKHNAIWKFKIKGNTMEGTLMYKDQLYRIIHLKKE
jgi:hypothetical protein